MNIHELKVGLDILTRYANQRDDVDQRADVCAEHDEIFLGGPHPDHLTGGKCAQLSQLGFTWRADLNCWHVFT